jgi:hypothetical protein
MTFSRACRAARHAIVASPPAPASSHRSLRPAAEQPAPAALALRPPAITVVVLAAAVLAGCASSGAAKLPPKTTAPTVASATPAVTARSAKAAVIAAYTGYFPVLTAAEAAGPSRAKAMLAPYAAQPYLNHVLSRMAAYRSRHEVSVGHLVPHVMHVRVRGARAQLRDCQDASHAALADSRTGRVIPHTWGSPHTYLIATLARGSDGQWRLTSLAHVAVPCKPVPSPS